MVATVNKHTTVAMIGKHTTVAMIYIISATVTMNILENYQHVYISSCSLDRQIYNQVTSSHQFFQQVMSPADA